jgi:hypothetical protein
MSPFAVAFHPNDPTILAFLDNCHRLRVLDTQRE